MESSVTTLGTQYPLSLMVSMRTIERQDQVAGGMLTDPPITNALLSYSTRQNDYCEVYSPTGITVRDVLEVGSAMAHTVFRYCEPQWSMNMTFVQVDFALTGALPNFPPDKAPSRSTPEEWERD